MTSVETKELKFVKEKHVKYIQDLDSESTKQTFEYWLLEHLRMNGLYWGVTALGIMNLLDALSRDGVVQFVLSCWDAKQGGFGAYHKHDAHILSTLSAIQILAVYDSLEILNEQKRGQLIEFIRGLQLDNGCFQGDSFGETDTRFVYTAIQALAILGELTQEVIDPAVNFIMKCENFDGAFGMLPGAESHAAQVFTCLGTLAITNSLHLVNDVKLGNWLSERQVLPSGGFNGRPEKLPDVCYSWWVLSSLSILGKKHWIDADKLEHYILACQDLEKGGISDREDNQTDVFHTCFGITGLSLIESKTFPFSKIDPIYCLPTTVSEKLKKWPADYQT